MPELRDGSTTQDPKLDRLVHFDPRSRDYPISAVVPEAIVSKTWTIRTWLNQGSEGACVSAAFAHEAAASPMIVPGITMDWARQQVYWEAQKIDRWAGGCVDADTTCLSRRGWLGPDDLTEGDEILAFDIKTETTKWATVERVHDYPMAPYRIWSNRGFACGVTDNHRWAIRTRPTGSMWRRHYHMKRTDAWTGAEEFPRAAPSSALPTEAVFDDDLVELVAWVICEGHYRKPGKRMKPPLPICLYQKTHLERVAALMTRFGVTAPSIDRRGGCRSWWISGPLAGQLRDIAPDRVPRQDWLEALTLDQLQLFLNVCELADGSTTAAAGNRQGRSTFTQKTGPILDAWLTACALAGQPVSRKASGGGSGGDCEEWCRRRSSGNVSVRKLRPGRVLARGRVWCPQTAVGTFIARRQGSVFITGNSYPGAVPQYEGTAVIAGAKVMQRLGFYDSYRWAFTIDDVLRAIGHEGPVVFGVHWREGMFDPRPSGLLDCTGSVAGGHAILGRGITLQSRLKGESTKLGPVVRFHNSWGKDWGRDGSAFIRVADLEVLLKDQGECCCPVGRHTINVA